ncbi:MAG: DNA polymerase ligase N-terminal domain-containing protein, partial [Spongiibacteraceae bacterium]
MAAGVREKRKIIPRDWPCWRAHNLLDLAKARVIEMDIDSLDRYQKKRNFNSTSEPAGKRPRAKKSRALSFVVQKHAARHLHYDFRLELNGTLKSWAVPKGPSLDPKAKRLAMAVEDHPLEYADFEGTIPAGNYGAGTVIVWDRGEWIPEGDPVADYARGEIKFTLRGTKLSGRWVLVKTHGRYDKNKNSWLLIKERDDEARAAAEFDVTEALPDSVLGGHSGREWKSNRAAVKAKPPKSRASSAQPKGAIEAAMPLTLAPQLAMLVDEVPTSGDWSYELKFDGYRILARIAAGEIKLFTRNGNDWTAKLKHLADALAKLNIESAWLDGELVLMSKRG